MLFRAVIFFLTVIGIFSIIGCTDRYNIVESSKSIKEESFKRITSYEYRVKPYDRLSIVSYKYPEITPTSVVKKGILVDKRGYINLPLIKRVKVAGLTQTQVAKLLERKYKRYLKYPTFNVEVLNKRAYVIGEVNKPGVIELDNEVLTVLEAIAVAGDLTDDAVKDNVIVLSRGSNGEMKMRKINLKDFDILKNTNMLIQPNDIIYVQPNDWKKVKLASNNINSIVSTFGNVVTPYLLLKGASN